MARTADPTPPTHRLEPGVRIGAVVSTYHHELTSAMLASARAELVSAGLAESDLLVVEVPGAFELPIVARSLGVRDDVRAVMCFGLVLKGETSHDVHIATSVSQALQRIALDMDKPVLFGVLTCDTLEQARARALPGGHDKGREVARAAVQVIAAMKATREVGTKSERMGFAARRDAGGAS